VSPPSTSPRGVLAGDEAPPGVARQFDFFNVGDPPCLAFTKVTQPSIRMDLEQVPVLTEAYMCLPGFDRAAIVDLLVTAPDGAVFDLQFPDPAVTGDPFMGEVPFATLRVPLGAATGQYDVTARQGDVVATGSFLVAEPTGAILRVAEPSNGPPGAAIVVQVAGLQPAERATIDVYRAGDGWMYTTTIHAPPADGRGHAEQTLTTSSGDPVGDYCFVLRGGTSCYPYVNEFHLG
jgi:hypothetical protein